MSHYRFAAGRRTVSAEASSSKSRCLAVGSMKRGPNRHLHPQEMMRNHTALPIPRTPVHLYLLSKEPNRRAPGLMVGPVRSSRLTWHPFGLPHTATVLHHIFGCCDTLLNSVFLATIAHAPAVRVLCPSHGKLRGEIFGLCRSRAPSRHRILCLTTLLD